MPLDTLTPPLHTEDLLRATAELHRRVRADRWATAWQLWECPCGGWWVVPTPPPTTIHRCPRGARPAWDGDDR
jgi:hypothetical protein